MSLHPGPGGTTNALIDKPLSFSTEIDARGPGTIFGGS